MFKRKWIKVCVAVEIVFMFGSFQETRRSYRYRRCDDFPKNFEKIVADHHADDLFGRTKCRGRRAGKRSRLSTASPANVEPMVRIQRYLPAVRIFIFARTNELTNSPAQKREQRRRTIRQVWPKIRLTAAC